MSESKSKQTKELSKEEKKALRRSSMSERGRLSLDDEYKEEGYRYRVCNVLPGNIENWKSKGYEVVTHNMKSGSGLTNYPEVDGNPVELEVGGANGSMKAIWMRISNEDAEILDEIRDEDAASQDQIINEDPIPQGSRASESPLVRGTNIGKITKENLR